MGFPYHCILLFTCRSETETKNLEGVIFSTNEAGILIFPRSETQTSLFVSWSISTKFDTVHSTERDCSVESKSC